MKPQVSYWEFTEVGSSSTFPVWGLGPYWQKIWEIDFQICRFWCILGTDKAWYLLMAKCNWVKGRGRGRGPQKFLICFMQTPWVVLEASGGGVQIPNPSHSLTSSNTLLQQNHPVFNSPGQLTQHDLYNSHRTRVFCFPVARWIF